jgi:hypothetical protein
MDEQIAQPEGTSPDKNTVIGEEEDVGDNAEGSEEEPKKA